MLPAAFAALDRDVGGFDGRLGTGHHDSLDEHHLVDLRCSQVADGRQQLAGVDHQLPIHVVERGLQRDVCSHTVVLVRDPVAQPLFAGPDRDVWLLREHVLQEQFLRMQVFQADVQVLLPVLLVHEQNVLLRLRSSALKVGHEPHKHAFDSVRIFRVFFVH